MKLAKTVMICLFAALFPAVTHAASMVEVTYSADDEMIATMIYSGEDGGPNSEPAKYWKLLGSTPEFTSTSKIKPDNVGGNTAKIAGAIRITVLIRNKYSMGTATTNKLTLIRDKGSSNRWYLSAKELKRIQKLIKKDESRQP